MTQNPAIESIYEALHSVLRHNLFLLRSARCAPYTKWIQ